MGKYFSMMAIRVVCFVLMVAIQPYGWYTWLFAIGAVLLGHVGEAATLAFLFSLAEALEDRAMDRAKEGLLVDFINQTDLDQIGDKASVIDAFFTFAQAEQQREAQELIDSEDLNRLLI